MEDLRDFTRNGKSFYEKTRRAWKRGYLLYGPPETGKSSLIAAMANFLEFDIYDLELTEVESNSELKTLLMTTTLKSIVVIKDIDCSIESEKLKGWWFDYAFWFVEFHGWIVVVLWKWEDLCVHDEPCQEVGSGIGEEWENGYAYFDEFF